MPTRSTADLIQRLAEEECSNETLRQKLATALCTQTQQHNDLTKLRKQVRDLTKRLKSKDKQIAEQNEELFELRTQVAALTDCLKQRAYSGTAENCTRVKGDRKGQLGGLGHINKNNSKGSPRLTTSRVVSRKLVIHSLVHHPFSLCKMYIHIDIVLIA